MARRLRIAVRKFDPFENAIVKQFADFQDKTGIDATLEAVPMDLNPLHETLFADGGLQNGEWDIAFMPTDWLAEALKGGLIADLAPRMAADPVPDYPDGWSSSLTTMHHIDGGVFGIPYHDGPQCLIYRTDLLSDPANRERYRAETGRELDVPKTWDEFLAVAHFLHAPAEGRSGTVLAAYPDGHNAVYDFCIQLWTRGGEPFDGAGRLTVNTTEGVAALDFYRGLANDASACADGVQSIDSVKSGLMFCEGKVAMMANWFGFAALGETLPDSPVKGKVDVAPIPAGPGGSSVSLNVYWMLCLASGSRQPDLAYAFMKHAVSAPMDRITTLEGAIGCRKSTWADADVNRTVPYYHKLDALHAHARQLPVDARLPRIAAILDAMVDQAIRTDRPSAELLAEAEAEAAAV